MHRGYYKAWRKVTDSISWSRGLEYRGLIHSILVKVNHKPLPFRGEVIPSGSFAVVMTDWCVSLGVSRQKLHRMLKVLTNKPDQFISVENVGNRFSLITVLNWGLYQSDDEAGRATNKTTAGQPPGNRRATTGQQNKNDKNNKKAKKKNPPKSPQGGSGYTKAFEAFWIEYPKKVAKAYAFKCWKKIKGVDALTIIDALKAQLEADHFRGNDGQHYFPNPGTWLNQGRWEDEIDGINGGDDELPPELRR
ncbi:hypothetical protein GO013_07370 [Pseudodesulfovibrio sp. JC047]|nr:hypothetical protein [Pseudodesulfovibrio sp. JC047]